MVEFVLILGALVIYFTPVLVAAWVRHPKLAYIGGVNAALGVTVVGWAGALMWALRRRKVVALSYHGDMQVPRSFNVGLLAMFGLLIGGAVVATIALNRVQFHNSVQAAAPVYAASAVTSAPVQWQYVDEKEGRVASLQSSNSPGVPAAYKGGPVTLSVVHATGGAVVRLDADSELACSYAPTASSIEASFDGGPSQVFACAPAPAGTRKLLFDGDHSTAYLADPTTFLARLKSARHVSLTTSFAGVTEPQTLEYDLPAQAPTLPAVAQAAAVAAVPVVAMAAVAPPAATASPAADGKPSPRHHHHHHRAARHGAETYVDGVHAARGRRHGHRSRA